MQNRLETLLGVPLVDDAPLDTLLPAVLLVATAAWPPVGVLLAGYGVRVIRRAFADDTLVPPVDDVRALAETGLRATAVVGVYMSVPLVLVAALTLHSSAVSLSTALERPSMLSAPSLVVSQAVIGGDRLLAVGSVVVTVATLLAGYAATAALLVYAAEDRVVAAVDRDRVGTVVRSPTFLGAVLTALLLAAVGSTLGWLVGHLPLVGSLAGATVTLLSNVVVLRTVAAGYPDGTAATTGGAGTGAESGAATVSAD